MQDNSINSDNANEITEPVTSPVIPAEPQTEEAIQTAMNDHQDALESAAISEQLDDKFSDLLDDELASHDNQLERISDGIEGVTKVGDIEDNQKEIESTDQNMLDEIEQDEKRSCLEGAEVIDQPQQPIQKLVQSQLFTDLSPETQEKVEKVLVDTKLNWDVRLEELVSVTGLQTPNAGVYRNDNNIWLGTTSKKYTPYQNVELAATIIEAGHELNLEVTRGGELYERKRVFLQLELPAEKIGNTDVKRYITAMNSHNGLGSVGFGSTNNILNYDLTFYRVYNQLDKFRHHSSVQQKVKFAVQQLFKTISQDEKMIEMFKLMANTQIEDELLKAIMQQCFNVDLDANQSDLTDRQKNKAENVAKIIENSTKMVGETVWGLFTGILQTTKNSVTKSKSELDYVMGGEGYTKNLKAYNTICLHLEKNMRKNDA